MKKFENLNKWIRVLKYIKKCLDLRLMENDANSFELKEYFKFKTKLDKISFQRWRIENLV